ncbi:serine/threonine-protein kinase chk-1-like [Oratosquilla oratoria]|uniref:serine/threonine-protein kinase chk-1-like n=1 Tax=Oratosquilla oratoria TaxID=337810 RepID=UPI003F771F71
MRINEVTSDFGDLPDITKITEEQQVTSRDSHKDIEPTVGFLVCDFNDKKVSIKVEETIRKRKISHSEEQESSNGNKKMKVSDVFDPQSNWKEISLLGTGGFASVQLLENASSGLLCARKSIKIIRIDWQQEEIKIHKKLDHTNIITFLGSDTNEEYLYVFLEYAPGGSLSEKLKHNGLSEEKVRFYFVQLMEGVKYLHSLHITHRDLKPGNLLLSGSDVVKIGDFGLACEFVEGQYLTRKYGTMAYMAPEVFKRRYMGDQADIWSCGIILFKLLTTRCPWKRAVDGNSKYEIWSSSVMFKVTSQMREKRLWESLSEEAFTLVEKILNPTPKERATLTSIEENAWTQGKKNNL